MTVPYNPILAADSYKASHWEQYPAGINRINAYVESRGGAFQQGMVFGPQMYVKEYLSTRITHEMVDEAAAFWPAHGEPFNEPGWRRIVDMHGGHMPVRLQSAPEGSVLPASNVFLQAQSTDPELPWVASWIETEALRAVWYASTVATLSWTVKWSLLNSLKRTSDDPLGQIPFKLHDFGLRGVSSRETGGIGGAAHLVNFQGTDNPEGIRWAQHYYGPSDMMMGFSIPAAEHSTITSWGGPAHEADAFRNMLRLFGQPGKLVAVVSDSYDIENAVRNIWGAELKREVEESGATVVVRPDSGDPVLVSLECVKILAEKFGTTVNSKGYRVLPNCVRVIQGDGVNMESIRKILYQLEINKFSTENIAFGMGGALLQSVNRDTMKFAMKTSEIEVQGEKRDVFKDPRTDITKRSKKGRLALIQDPDVSDNMRTAWKTVREDEMKASDENLLRDIYVDGEAMNMESFVKVRERAMAALG